MYRVRICGIRPVPFGAFDTARQAYHAGRMLQVYNMLNMTPFVFGGKIAVYA